MKLVIKCVIMIMDLTADFFIRDKQPPIWSKCDPQVESNQVGGFLFQEARNNEEVQSFHGRGRNG